jgi:hypothetical protein
VVLVLELRLWCFLILNYSLWLGVEKCGIYFCDRRRSVFNNLNRYRFVSLFAIRVINLKNQGVR